MMWHSEQDTTPPKDPYIQVRVMDDVGEVLLDDQSTSLLRNSIHLMKRTEAESLVSQVSNFHWELGTTLQLHVVFIPRGFTLL